MKYTFRALPLLAFLTLSATNATAQCSVTSSNGYTVNMLVVPSLIEPATLVCPFGYNYKVRMAYAVWFTGSNIPSGLYTLQGTVNCNGGGIFFDLPNDGGVGTVLSSNAWRGSADCLLANPSLLTCNTVNVQIEGPGLPSQTIHCGFASLPVELFSFNAVPVPASVELEWVTASEQDNHHFTVERSRDGVVFMDVLELAGAGTSRTPTRYTATDDAPWPGLSYYRLRQTDDDGITTTSAIVAVQRPDDGAFTLSPNPIVDDRFELPEDAVGCMVHVRSASGALVYEGMSSSRAMRLPALPAGVYQVFVTNGPLGTVRTARLVKG